MLCFRKFLKAKKFTEKKEGKVSISSFEKVLSHSAEKCRREPFNLSLVSGIEKKWMRGCRGSVKTFRRKFHVSQCRKIS